MSKYKRIVTQLRGTQAVCQAAEAAGFTVDPLIGIVSEPVYAWMCKHRTEVDATRSLAIRVPRQGHQKPATIQLLFNRQTGAFDAEFDSHAGYVGVDLEAALNRVRQQYALDQVTQMAQAQGFVVQPVEGEVGEVMRLQLVRY